MTGERAAHVKLTTEPQFLLEDLRWLRVEIDLLLGFLPTDSKGEPDEHETKKHNSQSGAAAAVRPSAAKRGLATGPEDSAIGPTRSSVPRNRRGAREQGGKR
jgi:hypothetical protein